MSYRGKRPDLVGTVRTEAQRVTRFWMLVEIGDPDECWPWTGYTDEDGYGQMYDGYRMRGAHELALEWFSGEARPKGYDTCHKCHNPVCVNPAHLRFDSRKSNVADMVAAGRCNPTWRKLSDEDIVTIRQRAAGGATGAFLSREYGVSNGYISVILQGKARPLAGAS